MLTCVHVDMYTCRSPWAPAGVLTHITATLRTSYSGSRVQAALRKDHGTLPPERGVAKDHIIDVVHDRASERVVLTQQRLVGVVWSWSVTWLTRAHAEFPRPGTRAPLEHPQWWLAGSEKISYPTHWWGRGERALSPWSGMRRVACKVCVTVGLSCRCKHTKQEQTLVPFHCKLHNFLLYHLTGSLCCCWSLGRYILKITVPSTTPMPVLSRRPLIGMFYAL